MTIRSALLVATLMGSLAAAAPAAARPFHHRHYHPHYRHFHPHHRHFHPHHRHFHR